MLRLLFLLLALLAQNSYANDQCAFLSKVCADGPGMRVINGVEVTRDCWRYDSSYKCNTPDFVDDCSPLVERGCAQIGSTCIDTFTGTNQCNLYEQKYQCLDKEGSQKTEKDCSSQMYCMDGNCTDASYEPDQDFQKVITYMETVRQAGQYLDEDSLQVFGGVNNKCSIKLGSDLFSCCKKNTSSGGTNNSMVRDMAVSTALNVGKEAVQVIGSKYVFDSYFAGESTGLLKDGMSNVFDMGEGGTGTEFNPALSYYGMTFGYGTVGSGVAWSTSLGSSQFYVGFDPYSLAISLAIQLVIKMTECDQSEQMLSLKRGQNLCAYVGSYCSNKVLGSCVTKKESYCCYNSHIARIVAIEGRKQLGIDWGGSKNPDCRGFTIEELDRIDFSQIDFSEIIGEIGATNKLPDFAVERAQDKIKNYYEE